MGRAQGGQSGASAAVSARGARTWSLSRAHREVERLVRADDFQRALAAVQPHTARILNELVAMDVPGAWCVDHMLPTLTRALPQAQTDVLRDYMRARLAAERPLLQRAGFDGCLDDAEQLFDLRAWHALCAADLIRASRRVRVVGLHGTEAQRMREALADGLTHYADLQLLDRPLPIEEMQRSLCVLTLTPGLTDPRFEDARQALYGDGAVQRTRRMLKEGGVDSDAPALIADLRPLLVMDSWPPERAQRVMGTRIAELGAVVLAPATLPALREANARGGHCKTLAHELIHSAQKQGLAFEEDMSFAQYNLHHLLCEGATEAETRRLCGEPEPGEDHAYQFQVAFVQELARSSCGDDERRAGQLVHELAVSDSMRARHELAAQSLLGAHDERACEALLQAVWELSEDARAAEQAPSEDDFRADVRRRLQALRAQARA